MNENEMKILRDLIMNLDDYFQDADVQTFDRDIAVALYVLEDNLKQYE